jgi:hypothetical protein
VLAVFLGRVFPGLDDRRRVVLLDFSLQLCHSLGFEFSGPSLSSVHSEGCVEGVRGTLFSVLAQQMTTTSFTSTSASIVRVLEGSSISDLRPFGV